MAKNQHSSRVKMKWVPLFDPSILIKNSLSVTVGQGQFCPQPAFGLTTEGRSEGERRGCLEGRAAAHALKVRFATN